MLRSFFQTAFGTKASTAPDSVREGMRWEVRYSLACTSFEVIKVHPGTKQVDILEISPLRGNRVILNHDWDDYWSYVTGSMRKSHKNAGYPHYVGIVDVSEERVRDALTPKYRSYPNKIF